MDKGVEKLERDLDIVSYLEMVHGYRVMKQVLFDEDDRFFLNFQRRDLIDVSESDPEQEQLW